MAKATLNIHRETTVTAPVLDSTREMAIEQSRDIHPFPKGCERMGHLKVFVCVTESAPAADEVFQNAVVPLGVPFPVGPS